MSVAIDAAAPGVPEKRIDWFTRKFAPLLGPGSSGISERDHAIFVAGPYDAISKTLKQSARDERSLSIFDLLAACEHLSGATAAASLGRARDALLQAWQAMIHLRENSSGVAVAALEERGCRLERPAAVQTLLTECVQDETIPRSTRAAIYKSAQIRRGHLSDPAAHAREIFDVLCAAGLSEREAYIELALIERDRLPPGIPEWFAAEIVHDDQDSYFARVPADRGDFSDVVVVRPDRMRLKSGVEAHAEAYRPDGDRATAKVAVAGIRASEFDLQHSITSRWLDALGLSYSTPRVRALAAPLRPLSAVIAEFREALHERAPQFFVEDSMGAVTAALNYQLRRGEQPEPRHYALIGKYLGVASALGIEMNDDRAMNDLANLGVIVEKKEIERARLARAILTGELRAALTAPDSATSFEENDGVLEVKQRFRRVASTHAIDIEHGPLSDLPRAIVKSRSPWTANAVAALLWTCGFQIQYQTLIDSVTFSWAFAALRCADLKFDGGADAKLMWQGQSLVGIFDEEEPPIRRTVSKPPPPLEAPEARRLLEALAAVRGSPVTAYSKTLFRIGKIWLRRATADDPAARALDFARDCIQTLDQIGEHWTPEALSVALARLHLDVPPAAIGEIAETMAGLTPA